jgi:hypothetical protein
MKIADITAVVGWMYRDKGRVVNPIGIIGRVLQKKWLTINKKK